MMSAFVDYHEHAGVREEKFYKTTLFGGEHVMAGLNCLEPGQEQDVHSHDDQDKFYFVVEGRGTFTVGEERLVLLIAIAPPPGQ